MTRVTNPNIKLAAVKLLGLEVDISSSEKACMFLGYTSHV
jgi:hypothetical protein